MSEHYIMINWETLDISTVSKETIDRDNLYSAVADGYIDLIYTNNKNVPQTWDPESENWVAVKKEETQ